MAQLVHDEPAQKQYDIGIDVGVLQYQGNAGCDYHSADSLETTVDSAEH